MRGSANPSQPALRIADTAARCFLLLIVVLVVGCSRQPQKVAITVPNMLSGMTMGTTYSVKYVDGDKTPKLVELSKLIDDELREVNQQMSTYIESSELSRFNQSESTDWFEVSPATAQVVHQALNQAELTEGAFDVTVGPLVNLWGFGPGGRPLDPPSTEAIAKVMDRVGPGLIEVRLEPASIKKLHPNVFVDLSAIAKGHGVDRIAELLNSNGVENYLVEIGGELRGAGIKPDGTAWQVGLERPDSTQRVIDHVIGLTDQSLATSGNYRNFYRIDGKVVSHTIDPRTGQPVDAPIAAASAVADTCAEADAIATSMMALGSQEGMQLANQLGWCVLITVPESSDTPTEPRWRVMASSKFSERFPEIALATAGSPVGPAKENSLKEDHGSHTTERSDSALPPASTQPSE